MNLSGLVAALLPVSFVLALGYVAGKRNAFDADQAAGLSKLAVSFALPASLFVGMTEIPRYLLLEQGALVLALIPCSCRPFLRRMDRVAIPTKSARNTIDPLGTYAGDIRYSGLWFSCSPANVTGPGVRGFTLISASCPNRDQGDQGFPSDHDVTPLLEIRGTSDLENLIADSFQSNTSKRIV